MATHQNANTVNIVYLFCVDLVIEARNVAVLETLTLDTGKLSFNEYIGGSK